MSEKLFKFLDIDLKLIKQNNPATPCFGCALMMEPCWNIKNIQNMCIEKDKIFIRSAN
jgi:hypothetical protein